MAEGVNPDFCCHTLRDVIADLPEPASPSIYLTEEGVLMMVVGIVETEDGLAYMDQAVAYCPFCGTHIQDVEALAKEKIQ
ncbi:MAG: hypothetical protein E5V16_19935 [Mesorhizobium sp.]|jgi:hypothetical protein|uniref:hypothetical protein n=1 Tax=Mesorhizobium sp. TaxID=1871066 RepID=UPI000FE6F06B|nr:hypothetical protein [Mesorhizobium sp.]RWE64763.1 MAG: hypothetical protein EOS62_27960 [Mesorhizobium sp.]TIY07913.1 MAG: hypothetical protein E5V16_19935 [Mesorhizobium sp.]